MTCGLLLFSFKTRGGFKETRGEVNSRGLRMQTLSEMQWPGLKFDTIIVFWQHFIKEYAEIGEHRLRDRHKGKNTHLFAHSVCVVLAPNSRKESYKSGEGTNKKNQCWTQFKLWNSYLAGWLRVMLWWQQQTTAIWHTLQFLVNLHFSVIWSENKHSLLASMIPRRTFNIHRSCQLQ